MSGNLTDPALQRRPAAAPRLVLLGASNLSFALSKAAGIALHALGAPLSLYVAHGPGRSYGIEAGPLWIRYPGILGSGVLEALESANGGDRPPTWALLTDLGNDIPYGVPVETVLAWITEIARRLRAAGARVGVTSLPVESLCAIPAFKFRVLRPLFFPTRPMRREDVIARACELQTGLEGLVESEGIQVLPTRRGWYGFDHFHLRARSRGEAFRTWLGALLDRPGAMAAPPRSLGRLRFHRPLEYLFRRGRRPTGPGGRQVAPGVVLHSF